MNNRGQTTILFSFMISVLFLFTLTALEVGRIYMSKVKTRAIVHSTCSNLMADYNRELFERYHLLFMDPTYGTGGEAAAEEKIEDYLDVSLNGDGNSGLYQFTLEELAVVSEDHILDNNMELLKKQIIDYEKTEGIVHKAKDLGEKLTSNGQEGVDENNRKNVEDAARETEINGVELPQLETEETNGEDTENVEVSDPRDTLKECLKNGLLSFILPDGSNVSKESYDFQKAPSKEYKEQEEGEKDTGFQDISFLKGLLNKAAKEESYSGLSEYAAFVDYGNSQFSNYSKQKEDTVLQCETEYILKGKNSDYDNLQAVIEEITWLRMPVNYAYLLTDNKKKSEALTLAATICTATGTEAFIEVVKYLLLGCWAYGETIYEMRLLLSGEKIAYVKTSENWNTDLQTLSGNSKKVENGMQYEDYLMILLAKNGDKKRNLCYARMLDVIEKNLQKEDENFQIANCVGSLAIQGKVRANSLFIQGKSPEVYEYFFEESFTYDEK